MTEKEKSAAMNHIEAAIACGGGKMTPERRELASAVLDGGMSEDDAIRQVRSKYGAAVS